MCQRLKTVGAWRRGIVAWTAGQVNRQSTTAFVLAAILGTLGHSLLVNDGAVFVAASWLGNAWDLYFRQLASRSVSTSGKRLRGRAELRQRPVQIAAA